MTTTTIIIAILAAFCITYIAVPVSIKIAHRIGAIDKPNNRKVHENLMPRLGGLAIFLGFIITMLL